MPDVDIDFFDRDGTLKLFKHTPASMIKGDKTEKHKTAPRRHNMLPRQAKITPKRPKFSMHGHPVLKLLNLSPTC